MMVLKCVFLLLSVLLSIVVTKLNLVGAESKRSIYPRTHHPIGRFRKGGPNPTRGRGGGEATSGPDAWADGEVVDLGCRSETTGFDRATVEGVDGEYAWAGEGYLQVEGREGYDVGGGGRVVE